RRVIVQDVNAPAKRADDEIIHLFLNGQVADGYGRQSSFEPDPALTAIGREVDAELRAGEEQVWIDMVLGNGQDRSVGGKIALDRDPVLAGVGALKDVRREIGVLVVIEGGENSLGRVLRSQEPAHVSPLRDARELIELPPLSTAVVGDLDE